MRNELEFHVNPNAPVAVYVQIENHVRFAITSGKLRTGDRLPSVRDLSALLDVNPNTVTKALRDLELMGLIVTRRGIGVTVSEGAAKRCRKEVHEMIKRHLRDAVGESLAAGHSASQIEKLVKDAIASGYRPYRA